MDDSNSIALAEEYRLLTKIGSGSFGKVYKTEHIPSGKTLAVKLIDLDSLEDDLADIIAELSVLSECSHNNITRFYRSFVAHNYLWIVMEFLEAGSMRDVLALLGPLPEHFIAAVIHETLVGLDYLHKLQRVHRDIKSANILLGSPNFVKLADFGVTARLSETVQKRNTFVGTPFWMAPEVIEHMPYDQRCDIWSLGITAIELATGEPPHAGLHPMRALFLIPKTAPPTLPNGAGFSKEFRSFVDSCLIRTPEKRPSVESLLKHPFLKKMKGSRKDELLRELVREAVSNKGKKLGKDIGQETRKIMEESTSKTSSEEQDVSWDFSTVKEASKAKGVNTGTIKINKRKVKEKETLENLVSKFSVLEKPFEDKDELEKQRRQNIWKDVEKNLTELKKIDRKNFKKKLNKLFESFN